MSPDTPLATFINNISDLTRSRSFDNPVVGNGSVLRGGRSAAAETLYELHQHVQVLATALSHPNSRNDKAALAKQVEGDILVLEALGAIDDTICQSLIDNLYSLEGLQ